MVAHFPLAAALACVLLAVGVIASPQGDLSHRGPHSRRMLLGGDQGLQQSNVQGGSFTDWAVSCEHGRQRCPNLFLASWGYQCMTSDGQACCRKAGGKECTLAAAWAGAATPATWQGREMVGVVEEALAQQAPKHPAEPAEDGETQQEKQSTGATTSGGDEQAAGASKGDEKDQQGDSAGDKQAQGKGDAGDKEQQQQGDGQGEHKKHGKQQSADMKQDKADGDSQEGEGGKGGADSGKKNRRKEASSTDDGEDGSGKWRRATATHYTSYPPCCHDPSADQSECEDYSGCKWEGQFAGVGKKSEEWVRSHDIVGLFQAPNAENRREWSNRWNGKRLRLKNPETGETMEVTVIDTCDDSDCKGCCTRNAQRNGGTLIDLEWHTAKRFWGGRPRDVAAIQWQEI